MSKKKVTSQAVEPQSLDEMLGGKDSFIVKYKNHLMIGTAALVVFIIGILAYFQLYSNPRNEAANNAIYPCQNLFAQTEWEKALNGDSTGCVGFLKVADQYSGTKAGNLANAYSAVCYYNLGKYDDAIKYAEKYDAADDNSVSPAVIGAMGNLYVFKNNNDKALELLDKAAKTANDQSLTPVYLLQEGEIYEKMGQNDKALKCYQQIKDNYKTSPLYQQIDKYIERINVLNQK